METVGPQEYTIEGLTHNDGSVIKISVASNMAPLQPKSAQSYLMSFRLVWHLPHGQLHVMRVTADTSVGDALHRLLRERDLTHNTFLVYDTREPSRSLNVRETLGDRIRDLTLEWADEAALAPRTNVATQSRLVLYLLAWHLPDGHAHAVPVSADTTVSEALHWLFRYADLRYGRYMVYNTREPNQPLHESLPLGHYGIRELTLVKRTSEAAAPSYPALTVSSVSSRKSSQRSVESVDSRRPSPVQAMSASSAESAAVGRPPGQPSRPPRKRAKAPAPPAPPALTAHKKRPAPQPPTSVNSAVGVNSVVKSNSSTNIITQATNSSCESMPINNGAHNSLQEVEPTPAAPTVLQVLDTKKVEDDQPSDAPVSLDLAHELGTKHPLKNNTDVGNEEKILQQNNYVTLNDKVPTCVAHEPVTKHLLKNNTDVSNEEIVRQEDNYATLNYKVPSSVAHELGTKHLLKNNTDVSNEEKILQQDNYASLNDKVPSSMDGLDTESLDGRNINISEDQVSSLSDDTQYLETSKETVERETHKTTNNIEKREEYHQENCSNLDTTDKNSNVLINSNVSNREVPNNNNLYDKTNDNLKQLSSEIVRDGQVSAVGKNVNGFTDESNDIMDNDNNIIEDSAKNFRPVVASSQIDSHSAAASLMCHHVETPLPDKISTKQYVSNHSVDETSFSSYRPSPTELLKQIELIKKDSKPKLVGAVRKVDLAQKELKATDMPILENNKSDKSKNTETKNNQLGSVTEALRRLHTQDMYIIPTNYSNTFERSYRAQPKITKVEASQKDNNNSKAREDILQPDNQKRPTSLSLDRNNEVKKVMPARRHHSFLNNVSMSHPEGVVDEHRKGNGVSMNGTNKNNIANKSIGTNSKIITPPRFVLNSWKDLPKGPSVVKIADDSTHGSSADVDFQLQCLKFEEIHSPVPSPPLQGLTSIIGTQSSGGLQAPSANI